MTWNNIIWWTPIYNHQNLRYGGGKTDVGGFFVLKNIKWHFWECYEIKTLYLKI